MPNMISCAHCQKSFNQKSKHCPFCGVPRTLPITKNSAICPRCDVSLEIIHYRGFKIDGCPSCKGLWLDLVEFRALTSEKDVYNDAETRTDFIRASLKIDDSYYQQCVRCDNIMNRLHFKRISGVVIDVCAEHGVWFDENELTQVRNFIASGGLDQCQDREISRNSTEIMGLATKLDNHAFIIKVLHRWDKRRFLFNLF